MQNEDLLRTIATFKGLLSPTISPEEPTPYPEGFPQQLKFISEWIRDVLEPNFEAPGVNQFLLDLIEDKDWLSDSDGPFSLQIAMLQAGCLFALRLYEWDIRMAMQEEENLRKQPE